MQGSREHDREENPERLSLPVMTMGLGRLDRVRTLCTLALQGACAAICSFAAADDYGATANAARERFEEARSRTVVTAEESVRAAPSNVSDVLELAHGVIVQRTASGSGTPFLRGLTGYQVLLMADDLRLNDSLTRAGGSASLNLLDPESVERIEVIREPASVLYGSDALGGVVHVRTKGTAVQARPETHAVGTAAVRAASAERALRAQASVRAVSGPFGARLSGGLADSGRTLRGDQLGPQPFTGHGEWSLSGKLELAPNTRHLISVAHQSGHLFDMPRPDVSTQEDQQTTASLDREATLVRYSARLWDGRARIHTFVGYVRRSEVRDRTRPMRLSREQDRVLGSQAGVRAGLATKRGGNVEVGMELSLERIDSTRIDRTEMGATRGRGRYVNDSAYDMFGLYALYGRPMGERLQLLLGARSTLVHARAPSDPLFAALERPTDLDRRFVGVTGSFGLRVQIAEHVRFTASLLGGFRAPNLEDFQAFGGGARGFTVPNRELGPERSWTVESGVEVSKRHWHAQAYAFSTLLDGLVVRVPTTYAGQTIVDGDQVITRRNASESLLAGGELTVTGKLDLDLYGGASTFLTWGATRRPDDAGNEVREPATKVPPPVVALRAGYARAPYFAEGVFTAQFPQRRLSAGDLEDVRLCLPERMSTCRVDGYGVLTFRAGLRIRDVSLVIAVENVLNSAYKTYASGADASGRNFVLLLRGILGTEDG